jgi:para-nitrobenzyl esterase
MEELLERSPLMEPMSEDCLYLNVFSPSLHDATQPPLPVLVWLHGGSYLGGSGELQSGYPFYDMRKLAASSTGAVVVSVNYRLGVFGFLSDDQLLKESGTSGTRPPEPPRHLAWRPR